MSLTLTIILAYSAVLPAGVGVIIYRRLGEDVRWLVWFFIAGLVAELAATGARILFHNNMPVIYIYTIAETWLVFRFITTLLNVNHGFRLQEIVITATCLAEFILHSLSFASAGRFVEHVLVLYSLALVVKRVVGGWDQLSLIAYVFVGLLLFYFSTGFVFSSMSRYLDGDALEFITDVHSVTNAIFNTLSALCLWKLHYSSNLLLSASSRS